MPVKRGLLARARAAADAIDRVLRAGENLTMDRDEAGAKNLVAGGAELVARDDVERLAGPDHDDLAILHDEIDEAIRHKRRGGDLRAEALGEVRLARLRVVD